MADEGDRVSLRASFLGSLPTTVFDDVMNAGQSIAYPSGSLIYDPQLSVITEGAFGVVLDDGLGRHLTVGYLGSPRAMGTSTAVGCEYPFAYQAVAASAVVKFSLDYVRELQRNFNEIGWAAASEVSHQLAEIAAELGRVAFQPVRSRVAHHLLALIEVEVMEGRPVRQSQIAAAVGSGREVVGRALTVLQSDGLVEIGPKGVLAIDQEGLRRVADQQD